MECNDQNFLDLSIKYDTLKSFDTFVIAEDGFVFKAHELFLSSGSEFFKAFFEFSFHDRKKSSECTSINLKINKSILARILNFLYSRKISLCKEYVGELAEAADFLLIDDLMRKCRNYMWKNISLDNCVYFLTMSYFLERLSLKERCLRFVSVNFNSIALSSDISKLPFDVFHDLIKENSLNVIDESDVRKAIVRWVESDRSTRLKDVPELLSSIRRSELSFQEKSSIADHIIFASCIRWSEQCLGKLCIAVASIFKQSEFDRGVRLEQLMSENEYKQGTRSFPPKVHFFSCERAFSSTHSDSEGGRITDIYMTYDEEMDMCRKITETTGRVDYLFAAGQCIFKFDKKQNFVTAYDLVRKEWRNKSPMRYPLEFGQFVQCKNLIFAVSFTRYKHPVEYYDTTTDKWIKCAPFYLRGYQRVTVLRDRLCVVGQYALSRYATRMKTRVYDTARDVWSDIAAPKQSLCSYDLINFHDRLFILGGNTGKGEPTRRVEVYNPETNEWDDYPPLPFLYNFPQAVIVQDKLIVYQDRYVTSRQGLPRPPPCTWNDKAKAWDVLDFLSYNRINGHKFFCVVDESLLKTLSEQNRDAKTVWHTSIHWNEFGIDKRKIINKCINC